MPAGIELATAYVSLVTETQGIVKAVNASLGQAEQAAERSGRTMGSKMANAIGGQLSSIGGPALGLLGVGGGIAAGIAAIVKQSGDLEQSQARLVTSAGESQANLAGVTNGLIGMAGQVGISVNALSTGMYTVESAGYHGADGLLVMKAAAQGARMEGAQLRTVADAVSTAMTDYHLPATQAATVTSQLVTAVGQGKTNMEEFSSSLHSITPLAASAGISLADVTGSLAEMTAHGMSADQASQNLADTLRHLVTPTEKQRNELAQLGMTTGDLQTSLGQHGLAGTLDMLSTKVLEHMGPDGKMMLNAFNTSKDAANNVQVAIASLPGPLRKTAQEFADGSITVADWKAAVKDLPANQAELAQGFMSIYNNAHGFTNAMKNGSPQAQTFMQALAALTGDATGLNTTLLLTGENAASTAHNIDLVAHATADAHGNVKGWDEIQGTFNQRLNEFGDGIEAAAERLGLRLLPPMTSALTVMDHGLTSMTSAGGALTMVAHGAGDAVRGFHDLPGPITIGIASLAAMRVASHLFGDEIGGATAKVKAFGTGFREEMALQRSLAAAGGEQIGAFGSFGATLEARSAAASAMGQTYRSVSGVTSTFASAQRELATETGGIVGSMRTAGATAVEFGGRVGGVAAAGVRGMSSAVGGVVGALGGPWTLGISAAIGLLGMGASAAEQAKATQLALRDAVTAGAKAQAAFGDAVAVANGKLSDQAVNAGADAVKAALTPLTTIGQQGHSSVEKANHLINDATGNVLGMTDAWEKSYDTVSGITARYQSLQKVMGELKIDSDDVGKIVTRGGGDYDNLIAKLRASGAAGTDMAATLTRIHDRLQETAAAAAHVTPGFFTLQNAMKTLSDNTATAADRASALHSALDILSGKPVAASEALQRYNQVARDTAQNTGDAIDKTQGWGAALFQASGAIDTTTANGDALQTKLRNIVDATVNAAASGADMGPIFARNSQLFSTAATQFGASANQVNAAAAQLGYSPKNITFLANLKGANDVSQQLAAIDVELQSDAKGVNIPTDIPNYGDVVKKLTDIGVHVDETTKNQGYVHVSIPPAELARVLDGLQRIIQTNLPPKVQDILVQEQHAVYFAGATDLNHNAIPDPSKIQGPLPITPRAAGGIDNLPGQARIQPKGTLIQWAEPETGGEAFIPLAPDKRGQSTAILGKVAEMFGLKVEAYARGGVHRGRKPASIPETMHRILTKRWPDMAMATATSDAADFTDTSANMDAAAAFIADDWPQSTELIHGGGFTRNIRGGAFVGDGIASYGQAVMNGAAGRVHWELAEKPSESGSGRRGHREDGLAHADTRTDRERVIDAIVAEGRRRGLPDKAIEIAIATALVESGAAVLANPTVPGSMSIAHTGEGSDHDSVGPFQQRASWGSLQSRMDPTTSAGLFYDRLAKVPYQTMDAGAAAQAVQHSANPGAYALRMKEAADLFHESVQRLSGDSRYYDQTIAPQAPELTAKTSEQEKLGELERAVREANGKRNSIYNDATASQDDRSKADDDLRDALQALAQEKMHPSANKSGSGSGSGADGGDAIERIANVGKSFIVGEIEDALQTAGLSGGVKGVVGAAINFGLDQLPAVSGGTLLGGRLNQQGLDQLLQQVLAEDPSHDIGKAPKPKLYDDGGWWLPNDGAVNRSPFAEPAAVFNGQQWGTLNAIANADVSPAQPSTVVHNNDFGIHIDRPGASIDEIVRHIGRKQRERGMGFVKAGW